MEQYNLSPLLPHSVQFSHSVMSNSLRLHGLQHARPPCPSPTPGVYSNSCSLSRWCYPTNSSSVIPFSSHLQFPPASGSFKSVLCIRWPKRWSFSFNISPSNEYSGLISFRMDWLDLLAVQGTLKSLLQHHSSKVSILWCSAFFIVQLSHPYTSPTQYTGCMPHPISKWPTRSLSHSLYPGYKSVLRTPIQHWFFLDLAHCS